MQFACVLYAGMFKHREKIPKYEKLMVAFCVCTCHILAYPNIYRHMASYDRIMTLCVGIWWDIRVSGFQMHCTGRAWQAPTSVTRRVGLDGGLSDLLAGLSHGFPSH
jgi:hypothetical protein